MLGVLSGLVAMVVEHLLHTGVERLLLQELAFEILVDLNF
jgi:hypothetical protein